MNYRQLFKGTLFYGLATVLPRIFTFILTPFYIAYLPNAADFGVISILMVYMVVGNILFSYGMETTYFRFVNKAKTEADKSKVQKTILTSILMTTLFFGAILMPFLANNPDYLLEDSKSIYMIDMVLIICFDALSIVPFAWLRNQGKSKIFSLVKIANVAINLALNILLFVVLSEQTLMAYHLEDPIYRILVALIIPSVITFLISGAIYIKIGLGFNFSIWKKLMNYALPIAIAGLMFVINELADRLFLLEFLEGNASEQVGIYSASYKLGVFMTLFITAFRLGIEPFFFQKSSDKDAKEVYAKITYYFVLGGSLILVGVVAFIDILKRIVISNTKEEYWEGLWIVPIILTANLCLGLYHNLSVWYKVSDKTRYGLSFSSIGALITIGLNITLIPLIGYKGSAIATLVSYAVMLLLSFVVGRRKYPVPYDLKRIGIVLGAAVILSYSSYYLFDANLWIGIVSLILFITLIAYLERNWLKRILQPNT